jgi:hypothetical protein
LNTNKSTPFEAEAPTVLRQGAKIVVVSPPPANGENLKKNCKSLSSNYNLVELSNSEAVQCYYKVAMGYFFLNFRHLLGGGTTLSPPPCNWSKLKKNANYNIEQQ